MITENIVLQSDLKKELKHLAIDKDTHVSLMLMDGAKYVLDNNKKVERIDFDSYEAFTMRIDKVFKLRIRQFCNENDIRMKDFWNEVAHIIVKTKGVLDA